MSLLPGWLLLLAGLGVVLMVVAAFFGIVRAMLRVIARLLAGGPGSDGAAVAGSGRRGARWVARVTVECPNAKCLHGNVPKARFCAQCGQPLARR
jgi:hypothetical protein